ncbi:hypothetical protein [Nocardia sp. NRRL S-836]|uniref:hypothetical protein n=1 Tax=Nocardia sp. NRRL S-836 TaxID=1519492 RepID=UPI0012F8C841|nr:hypothetical protein [Nocardia sp. NRRL S-836]
MARREPPSGVSDPAYSVRTTVSANGELAAVITDFDGTGGTRLRTVDRYGRTLHVATGAITSAVFRGTDLAYVGTLSRLDLATGAVKPLIASDRTTLYRDFRLVDVNGERHVSYVQNNEVYRCGSDDPQWLGLATENGKTRRLIGETKHHYRTAVWSSDGQKVAYELMGCVTDKKLGPGQLDAVSGVYVRDLATAKADRVVDGLSFNYALTGIAGGTAVIGSPERGYRKASGETAAALDRREVTAPAGRINRAEFVHQLWDTRDDFHGGSSCGPTSAVIDLVGYQLTNQFPVTVSSPAPHVSKWGRYLTDEFGNAGPRSTARRTTGRAPVRSRARTAGSPATTATATRPARARRGSRSATSWPATVPRCSRACSPPPESARSSTRASS